MQSGLKGMPETDLLAGFCEACRDRGARGWIAPWRLWTRVHPVYEGRAFRWDGTQVIERGVREYGPSHQGIAAEESAALRLLLTC